MDLFKILSRRHVSSWGALESLRLGEPWRVQTVNLHHVALAARNKAFRRAMETADYTTADGWPIVSLMRAGGIPTSRVTGSDWLQSVTQSRALKSHRVALIGGSDYAAGAFRNMIGETVCYSLQGKKTDWDVRRVAGELNDRRIQICIVAVTPPFGDIFAADLVSNGFRGSIVSVGGAVDMLVGIQRRAPAFARAVRVEWAWRLLRNPKRLARRYLLECLPTYILSVLPQTLALAVGRKA